MFAEHEAEKNENHKTEGGDEPLRLRRGVHHQEYQDQDWSNYTRFIELLYVQEVVTIQKKIFHIFASENEVYTIY